MTYQRLSDRATVEATQTPSGQWSVKDASGKVTLVPEATFTSGYEPVTISPTTE